MEGSERLAQPDGLLSRLYLLIHRAVYNRRLKRQRRFHCKRVISIGNLSAGGVGKTPLTAALIQKIGPRRCLALLRGYGAAIPAEGLLVSDRRSLLADARRCGDEAVLLARLTGAKVAAGPDRVRLLERFGEDDAYVFLDDAFQNPSVARDCEILVIDATDYPARMRLLPFGRYRDPLQEAGRADAIVLTRCDLVSRQHLKELREALQKIAPHSLLLESEHRSGAIAPPLPRGAIVAAFAGIGNPQAFFMSLRKRGVDLQHTRAFADHHWYGERDLEELAAGDVHWLTTQKDYVRLDQDLLQRFRLAGRIHSVGMRMHLRGNGMAQLLRIVLSERAKRSSSGRL